MDSCLHLIEYSSLILAALKSRHNIFSDLVGAETLNKDFYWFRRTPSGGTAHQHEMTNMKT